MPRAPRPTTWLGAIGLVGLCLVVYLPGFFALPPVDRDESRFAQASRQMLESVALPESARDPALHGGGLVVPRVQDRDRLNKPPLIYWLQAGSAAAFTGGNPLRDAIWMYRVPSLLAAIAAVLMTWRLGASMFDARTGRLAAALLACCPLIAWEARQARADMVLLALNTATMLALWRVWTSRLRGSSPEASDPSSGNATTQTRVGAGWPTVFAFWITLALAILVKGPITPLVAGLTALSLCLVSRRWRWLMDLRPLLGIVVLAALVSPWVIAVGNRVGWDVYWHTVVDETLGRGLTVREGHWGPPGYHTVLLPILFLPGSLMTAAGVALAFRQGLSAPAAPVRSRFRALIGRRAGHPPYLFCLAWIVPAWIVFELAWTKLPHYTMPLYPAIALLSARAVLAAQAGLLPGHRSRVARAGRAAWLVIGAVLVAGVPAALATLEVRLGDSRALFTLGCAIVAILGLLQVAAAWRAASRGLIVRGQLASLSAFVVFAAVTVGVLLPRTRALWLSPRLLAAADTLNPDRGRPVAAIRFHEDSLVFLTRGRVHRVTDGELRRWYDEHPDGVCIVPYLFNLAGGRTVTAAPIRGFNYSKGRVEEYEVLGGPPW